MEPQNKTLCMMVLPSACRLVQSQLRQDTAPAHTATQPPKHPHPNSIITHTHTHTVGGHLSRTRIRSIFRTHFGVHHLWRVRLEEDG